MKLVQRFQDLSGLKLDEFQERARELSKGAVSAATIKLNEYRGKVQEHIPESLTNRIEAIKARFAGQ